MYEYTCPVCGKVKQVKEKPRKVTQCMACTAQLRGEQRKKNAASHEGECVFQPVSVMCFERNCTNCGWNPVVAKARLDAIMGDANECTV